MICVCNEVSKRNCTDRACNRYSCSYLVIITTENIEQAIARAGSKAGNKGYDCALSAIEMVNLIKQL